MRLAALILFTCLAFNRPILTPNNTALIVSADPTGNTDALSGFEAAMLAGCANSGGLTGNGPAHRVFIPAGHYVFSAPIPATSTYFCRGGGLDGEDWVGTTLSFPNGSGFAINLPATLRHYTIQNLLISVGGGSAGNNNALGGIGIGDSTWYLEFNNVYVIGPTTSTASCISTNGTSTTAFIDIDHMRCDGFGGASGHGFYFSATGTGAHLHIANSYSQGASVCWDISDYFNVVLDSDSADTCKTQGFFLHPNGGNSITGIALTSEGATGNAFQIYGPGGTVNLISPKTSGFAGSSATQYPFWVNFGGDLTITNPVTVQTGGSSTSSLDISGQYTPPKSIIINGCNHQLDLGFTAAASNILKTQGNAICSN